MIRNFTNRLFQLNLSNTSLTSVAGILKQIQSNQCIQQSNIHTSFICNKKGKDPDHFLSYNDIIYPKQGPDEERRPAYVCHQKCLLRYTPKKMQYVAWFVRGMSVDEALKQLDFCLKKGGAMVKETILEAQKLAVTEHNVEFKSNLWVAESFCTKAHVIKGIRRHARGRVGEVRYTFCHYFVRLEEGKPPEDYYKHNPLNSDQLLEKWKNDMRKRKVYNSL